MRRILGRWRLVLGLCLLGGVLQAADGFGGRLAALQTRLESQPTNQTLLLEIGDLCHDEGVKDNPEAVKLAETYFLRLLALNSNHARARVMYGSTLTMKGRDAFWPTTQVALVKAGNKEMDAAVALAPEDPQVRLARAVNNVHMPKFLGREDVVRADYAWLWERISAGTDRFSVEEKQTVAWHQGRFLWEQKKRDAARQVWQKGMAMDPASALGRHLSEMRFFPRYRIVCRWAVGSLARKIPDRALHRLHLGLPGLLVP